MNKMAFKTSSNPLQLFTYFVINRRSDQFELQRINAESWLNALNYEKDVGISRYFADVSKFSRNFQFKHFHDMLNNLQTVDGVMISSLEDLPLTIHEILLNALKSQKKSLYIIKSRKITTWGENHE